MPDGAGPMSFDELPATTRESNGVTETLYVETCAGEQSGSFVWVPNITAADLLPALSDRVRAELQPPQVQFEGLDPEFGWAYVTVPLDFRVTNLAPVSVTASVAAGPLFVWATVTATPSTVTFLPGEPRGGPMSCSSSGAAMAYYPDTPGECSYTYRDTSAISANGRTFTTTLSVDWVVTYDSSSGSGTLPTLTLSSSTELAVAEIQALVTCTGPRPEQGGCG